MKNSFCKLILGAFAALLGIGAQAQGLQGVIVENYHTTTQADADYYNGLGNGSGTMTAGLTTYRVFIDMAPNYKLNTVFGSSGNVLDISSTTVFWNDDGFGSQFPPQTSRHDDGSAFDSWITIGRASRSGGAAGCTTNLEMLGVTRAADPDATTVNCTTLWSGFGAADKDGYVAGASADPTLVGITAGNLAPFVDVDGGNAFTTTGSWALLPPLNGPEVAGENRVLIGQFTTAGTFTFHINISLQTPGGQVEFYTHSTSESGSTVSPFLTYPVQVVDADGDGVPDGQDQCPGTAAGAGVNTQGCSCAQVTVDDGNPCTLDQCTNGVVTHTNQDADTDGVCDANDQCPGTAAGAGVNTQGCSCAQVTVDDGDPCTLDACTNGVVTHTFQDTDADGVCNANDDCPGTAAGAGVNADGCSCAQVTVDDGDPCTLDACLNGVVTHTFQDTDADGVCNANDDCPGTAAGAGVNADGCSCAQVTVDDGDPCTLDACLNGVVTHTFQDTDADGVCNANDDCPGTVAGAGVNVDGCSCAQVTVDDGDPCTLDACTNGVVTHTFQDADSDGTCDANDQCPGGPEPGTACNDLNPATSGDVIQPNCVCAGVLGCTPGAPCNDFNACTTGEVFDANCNCGGGTPVDPNDNNPCTLDSCDPVTGVSNVFQDADADGVCDANDDCPGTAAGAGVNVDGCSCAQVTVDDGDPCTLDACTNGVVAHTFQDADSDGTCDANDQCPGGPEPGTACNDLNPATSGDVIQPNCVCAGVLGCTPGAPCNDFNACTTGEVFDANCNCGGGTPVDPNDNNPCTLDSCDPVTGVSNVFQDADADGVCDANDDCPGTAAGAGVNADGCSCAQVTVDDGDPCTLDACTNGVVTHTFQDTDGDGICNANDICPLLANLEPGDPCNDNNPGTGPDVVGANCICSGPPTGCTNNLDLVFSTDANSSQTTWEIIPAGGGAPACSGGGLAPNADQSVPCCLADGCWRLRVSDSAGDGMSSGGFTGGYILQTSGTAQRIIDNRNNFSTGTLSAASNAGFCLPLGADKLIFSSCDKLDWVTGNYIVASANPVVSALWNVGSTPAEATTGYEFQIFNPNGGYVYNRFRNHATSDGFAPDNATRACHMKINNWAAAQHIPANVLMNVRVRSRVNGVNSEWGPVCRFKIDPVRAACPLTKLSDTPGSSSFSCGVTRSFGPGSNYVYAKPVTGANKYQFRFRVPGESFETVRTSNNYILQLNWITSPLVDGVTYSVDVRASKNGGLTWCTDPAPVANPWGDICQLTIDNTPVSGGNENITMEDGSTGSPATLNMYPNPNHGDQLYLSLDAVEEGVSTVSVDITDMFGKRVSARTIAVTDGFINTVVELNGEMANGLYLVHITAGEQRYTERLMMQK